MARSITRMSIHPDDLGFTYNEQNYSGFEEFQYGSDNSVSLQYPGFEVLLTAGLLFIGLHVLEAKLLASGAYPGAVTDPSQQDPTGKTPASIAETYGHKGLAGYHSEVALTSHISSLALKESELTKCSAEVEAERTVNSISNQNLVVEDHLSLKDVIASVRNAAQAASSVSKLTFGNAHHHNAALAIQKKYRGWKGRKDYLTLRKKVVKIQ
ncbi:calmodulin-binding transcription activator 4-like protein isoform X2, partial [Tanacetum coccineum]